MTLLRALRLPACALLMAAAVIGSTVAREGPVLLHQQNYKRVVGFISTDAAYFRNFYVAAERSRHRVRRADFIDSPFETPPLRNGFSGTLLVDVHDTDRAGISSRIRALAEQRDVTDLRLYLGLSSASDDASAGNADVYRIPVGNLELPQPGMNLTLVRFDIKHWEVADGFVSYDIDVSYWGEPARETGTVVAMGYGAASVSAASH